MTQTSARVELGDGGGELGPVGVVGDDEGELDAALAGAGAHLHPAGGEGDERVGEAADPGALEGGGGAEDDLAGEVAGAAAGEGGVGEVAEGDAAGGVVVAEAAERAVEEDGGVVAGGAEEGDQALGLAEGVDADEVGALGELGEGMQELGDLLLRRRVAEDREGEGGLGDEDVAGDGLEGGAGGVGGALVVAGGDDAQGGGGDLDLGGAEDVAGGVEGGGDAAEGDRLAVGGWPGWWRRRRRRGGWP